MPTDKQYRIKCSIDGTVPWGPWPLARAEAELAYANEKAHCGGTHTLVECKPIGRPKKVAA